jgi:hypothetical protein
MPSFTVIRRTGGLEEPRNGWNSLLNDTRRTGGLETDQPRNRVATRVIRLRFGAICGLEMGQCKTKSWVSVTRRCSAHLQGNKRLRIINIPPGANLSVIRHRFASYGAGGWRPPYATIAQQNRSYLTATDRNRLLSENYPVKFKNILTSRYEVRYN